MRLILTTNHKDILVVDECDFEKVKGFTWNSFSHGNSVYGRAYIPGSGYKKNNTWRQKKVLIHRLILGVKKGILVDHVNGNGLDNRRCNLRICDSTQNMGNRRKNKNSSSPFKGVHKDARRSKPIWYASIGENGRKVHLGTFNDPEDAARAYNVAATKKFGEFAKLNQV